MGKMNGQETEEEESERIAYKSAEIPSHIIPFDFMLLADRLYSRKDKVVYVNFTDFNWLGRLSLLPRVLSMHYDLPFNK